jgi:hypothetical protein
MGAFGYGITDTDDALDAIDSHRDGIDKVVATPKRAAALLAKVARRQAAEGVLSVAHELWTRGVDLRAHRAVLERHVATELADTGRWRDPRRRRAALAAFVKRITTKPRAPRPRALVYRQLWDFHGKYAVAVADLDRSGTRQQFARIDRSGNVVESLDFDQVRTAAFPCPARRGRLYGYVDAIGAWVIEPQFGEAQPFEHERAFVRAADGDTCWFIDARGKRISGVFERMTEHAGHWHVRRRGKDGLLDAGFKTVIPCRYDYLDFFFEGIARARNGKRFGLIDLAGRTVAPMTWDEMLVFSAGVAVVKKGKRAGYLRRDGELALPLVFDDATTFSSAGYAAASKRGKWGIIDLRGETVIPFAYKALHTFSEGVAAAQFDSGLWGYIDANNRVVPLYELSHALVPESGIPAAMMAGLVVGNMGVRRLDELVEFKEQLTVLLIGTLFVLLAADVRVADLQALGWRALVVVAALSLIVRPIGVALCTRGTDLSRRERLYLSWVAPRGIVAAAVASLFAEHLAAAGFTGGVELRALVFTVIAVTVAVQGVTAGPIASLLGLRRAQPRGYVFLGANPIARHLARKLADAGEPVELIDFDDDDDTAAAQADGLKVVHGNGIESRTLVRARVDTRNYAVALTSNEGVNLLFARQVAEDFYGPRLLVAIDTRDIGVQPAMLDELDARVMFGHPADMGAWIARWRKQHVEVRRYRGGTELLAAPPGLILPLVSERSGHLHLINSSTTLTATDVVELGIASERHEEAEAWLAEHGWRPADDDGAEPVLHGDSCRSSLPIPSDSSAPATWQRP